MHGHPRTAIQFAGNIHMVSTFSISLVATCLVEGERMLADDIIRRALIVSANGGERVGKDQSGTRAIEIE